MKIRARALTEREEANLQKSEHWDQLRPMCPLAIIGRADHLYIGFLNVPTSSHRVWLGDGQFYDDPGTRTRAPEGKTIEILWSSEGAYRYATNAAQELGIRLFWYPDHDDDDPLYYCSLPDAEGFLRALEAADRGLKSWYESRSILSQWVGPIEPLREGYESRKIQESVRRAFAEG